jgi:hypothetical protein
MWPTGEQARLFRRMPDDDTPEKKKPELLLGPEEESVR